MFMQNVFRLSVAGHELLCSQRKLAMMLKTILPSLSGT